MADAGIDALSMRMRPGTIAAATMIIVVGLAIGAWLATLAGGASRRTAPGPTQTSAQPRVAKAATPPSTPTTVVPTAAPSAAVRIVPTTVASTPAALATQQGSWRVDEANVQVGTIVWLGNAALSDGRTIVLEAHKASVAGRSAVPCERQTGLRASVVINVAPQRVPYRETNCQGAVSTGELRVQSFSSNGDSFSGSFWQDGVMLGEFTARKQ